MLKDFPKLESPFIRSKGTLTPVIANEYRWFIEPGVKAVDKLDGTNVSIYVENGTIRYIYNRAEKIHLFTTKSLRFYEGVSEACKRGYFIPGPCGQFFGELIGPHIRKNPYNLDSPVWVPFAELQKKYTFEFWDSVVAGLSGYSDVEIHAVISEIFKGLWSLFKKYRGIKPNIAEGIVFYSPKGEMCKLRRDMFPWYKRDKLND